MTPELWDIVIAAVVAVILAGYWFEQRGIEHIRHWLKIRKRRRRALRHLKKINR